MHQVFGKVVVRIGGCIRRGGVVGGCGRFEPEKARLGRCRSGSDCVYVQISSVGLVAGLYLVGKVVEYGARGEVLFEALLAGRDRFV